MQGQLGLQGEQKLWSASYKEGRKGKGGRVNSSCTESFECQCFCYIEKLGTVTPALKKEAKAGDCYKFKADQDYIARLC